jgi:hypothetical protein
MSAIKIEMFTQDLLPRIDFFFVRATSQLFPRTPQVFAICGFGTSNSYNAVPDRGN